MKREIRRSDFVPLGLPDIHFVLAACALACLGLLLVASSSIEVASDRHGQPFSFAVKHGLFLAIASVGSVVAYLIPTRWWYHYATYFLLLSIILLAIILIPGGRLNGEGCDAMVRSWCFQSTTIGDCQIYDDVVFGFVPSSSA